MKPHLSVSLSAALAAVLVTTLSAAPKFSSTWKSPTAASVNFAGKKVAALVITQDSSLQMSGEEALARELTSLGLQAVPTYRIAPKEELVSADRAKGWFERGNIEGVVALRPVKKEQRTNYNSGVWVSSSYSSFWGYYPYAWSSAYIPGTLSQDTILVVESLIFSVPKNELVWAAVSETTNPKTLQKFVEDLVKESVKELQKQGLARNVKK